MVSPQGETNILTAYKDGESKSLLLKSQALSMPAAKRCSNNK
jgi:hypothetical protein